MYLDVNDLRRRHEMISSSWTEIFQVEETEDILTPKNIQFYIEIWRLRGR
jgi:hypothetical protein